MKKYIYKVTNVINNKIYIGQTKNWKERFAQHKKLGYGNDENKILYKAINKYGIENFQFEVIEGPIENYNEREKYWISYYHSYIYDKEYGDEKGYNMTPGGENPPIHKGINSPFLKHDISDQLKVKDLLKNTKLTLKEISKKTGYDISAIKRINYGIIWYDNNIDYPIREQDLTKKEANDRALLIIYDLLHTNLTQKEIASKYGVSRSTVTMINIGQNNHFDNLEYPIRKIKKNNRIQGKPVLMIDINTNQILKEFVNATEAQKYLHTKTKNGISSCARGEQKTAYGYKWQYKE